MIFPMRGACGGGGGIHTEFSFHDFSCWFNPISRHDYWGEGKVFTRSRLAI